MKFATTVPLKVGQTKEGAMHSLWHHILLLFYVPGIYKDSHFFGKGVNPCIFLAHILWAGNIQGFTPFQMDQNLKRCESMYVSSI